MKTRLNALTLSKREKSLRRQRKKQHLIRTAQETVSQCIVTPAEYQEKAEAKGKKLSKIAAFGGAMFATTQAAMPAMAAGGGGDTFGTVKNTIKFMLDLLMGVGICFIAFGVISLAISFQSHDDSQKSKAIMAIVGGAIAISVKFVIQMIAPEAAGTWVTT